VTGNAAVLLAGAGRRAGSLCGTAAGATDNGHSVTRLMKDVARSVAFSLETLIVDELHVKEGKETAADLASAAAR